MSTAYAAFLRGINVGGKAKVPMADLRALLVSAGLSQSATYIQSGNAVFHAEAPRAAVVADLEARLLAAFGLPIRVVLRTGPELAAIEAASPWASAGETRPLYVTFLADTPTEAAVAGLDPTRSAPDEFRVLGREIHLRLVNGAGTTKLTLDWFERRLGVVGTARNWNTLVAMRERVAALA